MKKVSEIQMMLFEFPESKYGKYYLVVENSNINDYGMYFDEFDDLMQKTIIHKLKEEFDIWT